MNTDDEYLKETVIISYDETNLKPKKDDLKFTLKDLMLIIFCIIAFLFLISIFPKKIFQTPQKSENIIIKDSIIVKNDIIRFTISIDTSKRH